MSNMPSPSEILRHFPGVEAQEIVALGNAGGFSGARLWKITTPAGTLCLRRWPPAYPTEAVLHKIHGVLGQAATQGMTEFPVPLRHAGHDTVLKLRQALYELTPWMPGRADFHARPTAARLASAMTALGRFHAATRTYPFGLNQTGRRCSPGIVQRQVRLQELLHGELDRLAASVAAFHDQEINSRGRRLLQMFPACSGKVAPLLGLAASLEVSLQPCIRDIWHDHVFFTGDEVTGLIDFGAMRSDNVSCDLARLVGSLVADRPADWTAALDGYEAERPLTADEQVLIRAFDQSGVLMSGLSWLQWICVEGRRFDDRQRVLLRLDENLQRMEHLFRSV